MTDSEKLQKIINIVKYFYLDAWSHDSHDSPDRRDINNQEIQRSALQMNHILRDIIDILRIKNES